MLMVLRLIVEFSYTKTWLQHLQRLSSEKAKREMTFIVYNMKELITAVILRGAKVDIKADNILCVHAIDRKLDLSI